MAGDVIMKTNLCNLLQLNNATAGASGRAVWGVGLDHLEAETVGWNPA
jgi:hypothetical protein